MRRCAASGETLPEEALVRFVAGPGGMVVPDVAARLPGRGVWVRADRASIATAVKKRAFARGVKGEAAAPADLAEQVERLLARRCLDGLGLMRRAGALAIGHAAVEAALRERQPSFLVVAMEIGESTRDALGRLHFGLWRREPLAVACFAGAELGMALGRDVVIQACPLRERLARAWAVDLVRLSGFRAIVPASWPEAWRRRRWGSSDRDGALSASIETVQVPTGEHEE